MLTDLSIINSQPSTHFASYDGNGNVMALVNAADGSETARYEYGPFGETIRATGVMAKANPFRFSTKFTDDESGLLYYGYRYYNQSSGRWLSRDPIGEEGGANLHVTLNNEMIVNVDYLGHQACSQEAESRCKKTCEQSARSLGKKLKWRRCDAVWRRSFGSDLEFARCRCFYEDDCDEAAHDELQKIVDSACKDGRGGCGDLNCSIPNCCAKASARIIRFEACEAARTAINTKCYQGGDKGHKEASDNAKKAADNCRAFHQKNCTGAQ